MDILLVTLPLALILALVFVALFIFSVKKGQYEDLETPSYKILIEEESKSKGNDV